MWWCIYIVEIIYPIDALRLVVQDYGYLLKNLLVDFGLDIVFLELLDRWRQCGDKMVGVPPPPRAALDIVYHSCCIYVNLRHTGVH